MLLQQTDFSGLDTAAIIAVIMSSLLCFGSAFLVIIFVAIVINWRIYEKAGQQGWAGVIPIYSTFVLMDIIRRPRSWAWIILGLGLLSAVFSGLQPSAQDQTNQDSSLILSGLQLIFSGVQLTVALVSLYFTLRTTRDLAKSFGQGRWFTAGLIFLPLIFYPILAFGGSQYQYTSYTALPGSSDLTVGQ